MPNRINFLDLPREIRDQIYDYLLISPTGYITALYPTTSKATKSSSSTSPSPSSNKFLKKPPRSQLLVTAWSAIYLPKSHALQRSHDHYTLPSLSICRVNTQIHHETQRIFYVHNTLYLPHPFSSTKTFPSAIRLLKGINQTSSRLLQRIVLCLREVGSSYKFFRKVLQALASRARHGDFKTLILHVPVVTLECFALARAFSMAGTDHEWAERWEDMLSLFVETGGNRCRYEREVVFPSMVHASFLESAMRMAEDVNTALGGKLFWGGKIGYVDGVCLGEPGLLLPHQEKIPEFELPPRRQAQLAA